MLAQEHATVRDAVRESARSAIPRVRDRARGIAAQMEGLSTIGEAAARAMLSALARHVDGRPAFPHPLAAPSSTWLASLEVESVLRAHIDSATRRFADEAADRLGEDEEQLTRDLLKEISVSFRAAALRVVAVGRGVGAMPVALGAEYRQLTKLEEEPYGIDVAILARGRVAGTLELVSVEPVQVKKPRRGGGMAPFADAWSIDVPQLHDLLAVSQTAAYWLVGPDGVVNVVPARLIFALIRGAGAEKQGSRVVHRADIRSMGITLAQFLTDLVFGVWIGSSTAEAIAIAEGNSRDRRPRHLLEVKLAVGGDEQHARA